MGYLRGGGGPNDRKWYCLVVGVEEIIREIEKKKTQQKTRLVGKEDCEY